MNISQVADDVVEELVACLKLLLPEEDPLESTYLESKDH
jgi:hypothetical protein